MNEDFEKLRELLFNSEQNDDWISEFCNLISRVAREREEEYQNIWIPYCTKHRENIKNKTLSIEYIEYFEEWSRRYPFAFFSLKLIYEDSYKKDWDWGAFAQQENLKQIRSLWLIDGDINDSCCKALIDSEHLIHLHTLYLEHQEIGDEGCIAIAQARSLTSLRDLSLYGNYIGAEGCEALANSKNLNQLHVLNLSMNALDDQGLIYLAQSDNFQHLQHLKLSDNELGDESCIALAQSTHLNNLQTLDLYENAITERGYKALLCSIELPQKIRLSYLKNVSKEALIEEAQKYEITEPSLYTKQELVHAIWKAKTHMKDAHTHEDTER